MSEPVRSAAEVFDRLAGKGLLDRESVPSLQEVLAKPDSELPWLLNLFLAGGAWVAAWSFLLFMYLAGLMGDTPASHVAWGVGFIAAATLARRSWRHPFLAQLCLAMSLCGHLLFLIGVGESTDNARGPAIASIVLTAGLYSLYRDSAHRFITVLGAAGLSLAAVLEREPNHGIHGVILVEALLLAALLRPRYLSRILKPLLYGIAGALLVTFWAFEFGIETPVLPARVIAGSGLVVIAAWLARGGPWIGWALAAAAFASTASPGMSAALALMLLGAARRDSILESMGTLFFPAFLISFYYTLETTLLVKSLILMGSGALLLGVQVMLRWRSRGWRAAA